MPQTNLSLLGIDLVEDNIRLREINAKLAKGIVFSSIAAVVGVAIGLIGFIIKPEPERIAVDPAGRAVPVLTLTKNDPPDSRITKLAGECVSDLLNHAFHNYQTTVERAIGGCFTGQGSVSVRQAIDPLLERMKKERMNMAAQYVIMPFINSRSVDGFGRRVFHVQAVISVGYRGTALAGSIKPIEYALSADVVRVPYDSHIEGVRMQNLVLAIRSTGT